MATIQYYPNILKELVEASADLDLQNQVTH